MLASYGKTLSNVIWAEIAISNDISAAFTSSCLDTIVHYEIASAWMSHELFDAKNTQDRKGVWVMSLCITGCHHQQECQRTFSKLAQHLLTQAASMRRKSMSLSRLSQVHDPIYTEISRSLKSLNGLNWPWSSIWVTTVSFRVQVVETNYQFNSMTVLVATNFNPGNHLT